MMDKQIRENARQAILDAWNYWNDQYKPENISVKASSTGEIYFCFKIDEGDLGKGEIVYSPQPFFEGLLRESQEELDFLKKHSSQLDQEVVSIYWERKIEDTANILVRNIQAEFMWILAQQGILALSIYYEGADQIPVNKKQIAPVKKALEDFSKQRKQRIDFFLNEIKESHIAPQELFCHFYDNQKKLWTEIKKCYKINQKYPNPLAMVKAAYPFLLEDLLSRLTDPDPYASQPATIALYATAQITNVPKNINSVRALQNYLKGSRKMREEIPKENFEKSLLHYAKYVKSVWSIQDRITELKEKEKNTRKDADEF